MAQKANKAQASLIYNALVCMEMDRKIENLKDFAFSQFLRCHRHEDQYQELNIPAQKK